jgi:hypothetical protein
LRRDGTSVRPLHSLINCPHNFYLSEVQGCCAKATKCTRLTSTSVAYSLGIYLLNLFLAFISPKFDPSLEADEGMEDGVAGGALPTQEEEFRPFVRRLPEFKFWYSTTKAVAIGFLCSWFEVFNLPVFWPVLVVYWLILFGLTSKYHFGEDRKTRANECSATTNPAYDQVPIRSVHGRKDALSWRCEISDQSSHFEHFRSILQPHPLFYERRNPGSGTQLKGDVISQLLISACKLRLRCSSSWPHHFVLFRLWYEDSH